MPEFIDPNQVLKQIVLGPKITVADFGCGSGGWVIPLAKKLPGAKIYAIDIREEALSSLESKTDLAKVKNIKRVLADVEVAGGTKLADSSCDLVLLTTLLFSAEKKDEVFQEANRVLKSHGDILVVDWKVTAPLGPKNNRVAPETVKKMAEAIGLYLEKELKAGDYHYGLLFTKS